MRQVMLVGGMLLGLCLGRANAGDWPQILGPQRNGHAVGESLDAAWPAGGPRSVWEVPCGSGFAGMAVAEGLAILFDRHGDQEVLTAFAAETGKLLWKQTFPTRYQSQIVDDDGPRCVPTVVSGHVYAFGAEGNLHCVSLKDGTLRWSRAVQREFQAPEGYFGFGSAPVVDGNRVIVNVGGPKGNGVVAFEAQTGQTLWAATDELASYAAPVVVDLERQRRVLVITRLNFLGLDPATGREVFRVPFGARGPTVNGATPVVVGDHVLLTASYGIGARWVKVGADQATVAWEDEILSSQYTTPIVHEGLIYGIDGRQDVGTATLKCFDPSSRRVLWQKTNVVYATLVAADGKLLVQHTDGTLRMAALSPKGYTELAASRLMPGTTRALPALAHGRWYLRNERTLKCFDLRPAS
uniref:Pyrrolo-quinoline quinone n=1 Tax=Schlesneria paludicola TaxID=360056 RepID=A0A7C4QP12_9PLAN